MSKHDKFHDHLDECEWCREHCFNLCQIGAKLLQEAAGELAMSVFSQTKDKGRKP